MTPATEFSAHGLTVTSGQFPAASGQSLGYDLEVIDLFRTRLPAATRTRLREEGVVLRWPTAWLLLRIRYAE